MADPRGFLKYPRQGAKRRPVELRVKDWKEVYNPIEKGEVVLQAARCMDCGIPFCHNGCPLGNFIPDWNDLVYRDMWREAAARLHSTNNFPEFTGRLCPAPCEAACVLGIGDNPVSIELVEKEIAERAWSMDWLGPIITEVPTSRRVAIVGSGPAGLAAAQQLTRAGHKVVVFERADKPGGLLRYGIPEFKMQKEVLDRRIDQMVKEGTEFRCSTLVGEEISVSYLKENFDAVVLAVGSTVPRDLPIQGREAIGVHQAMHYLPFANRFALAEIDASPIDAKGKRVVIIGGGDTGADCLGTAHRQGAASVVQFEILDEPPAARPANTPWPTWPMIMRTSSAHEEGGERKFSINTERFIADSDGNLVGLATHRVEQVKTEGGVRFSKVEGSEATVPCELVFLALGFVGPEKDGLLDELGVEYDQRGNVKTDANWMTSSEGVFAAGDARRGQSLVVWAIAEGRSVASAVDRFLMGKTDLPAPLCTDTRALTA